MIPENAASDSSVLYENYQPINKAKGAALHANPERCGEFLPSQRRALILSMGPRLRTHTFGAHARVWVMSSTRPSFSLH